MGAAILLSIVLLIGGLAIWYYQVPDRTDRILNSIRKHIAIHDLLFLFLLVSFVRGAISELPDFSWWFFLSVAASVLLAIHLYRNWKKPLF